MRLNTSKKATELIKPDKTDQPKLVERKRRGKLKLIEIPETGDLEIQKEATAKKPAKRIRFPKNNWKRFQLMPEEFRQTENAVREWNWQQRRQREVFADSIESVVGYNSLLRSLGKHFVKQVAYYRSAQGGALPLEEARAAVYRSKITDKEAEELFDTLSSISTDSIGFADLLELNAHSKVAAENLWEIIKREARNEFESGHRAAAAFEPVDYMKDAWNRACYLGVRESFCAEYKPKGGIELSMIDAMAQAWLQLQYWTEQSILRAQAEPRYEDNEYSEWKAYRRVERKMLHQPPGHWDIPYVREQEAVEHAAQMADRWQRMYFRALRQLRDWRRYNPQVTINNPQQVNIGEQVNVASDGGQQVNLTEGK